MASDVAPAAGKAARVVALDGAVVTARKLHHGDAPAVGYRIDRGGRSVVFAGDIDRSGLSSLETLAQGADLLVVSCAVLDPPASPAELYSRHTGPRLLAETAARAGVGRLLFPLPRRCSLSGRRRALGAGGKGGSCRGGWAPGGGGGSAGGLQRGAGMPHRRRVRCGAISGGKESKQSPAADEPTVERTGCAQVRCISCRAARTPRVGQRPGWPASRPPPAGS
jgi:hypothetical protein